MQYTAKHTRKYNTLLKKKKKKNHCGGGLGNKPEVCQVLDSIISINTLSIKMHSYYSQKQLIVCKMP